MKSVVRLALQQQICTRICNRWTSRSTSYAFSHTAGSLLSDLVSFMVERDVVHAVPIKCFVITVKTWLHPLCTALSPLAATSIDPCLKVAWLTPTDPRSRGSCTLCRNISRSSLVPDSPKCKITVLTNRFILIFSEWLIPRLIWRWSVSDSWTVNGNLKHFYACTPFDGAWILNKRYCVNN